MEKKINRGVIRTGETDIKVHLIDSFPNHPYHVFDDEDMTELAASIEANGLLMQNKAATSHSAHLVVRETTRQWKKQATANAADAVKNQE